MTNPAELLRRAAAQAPHRPGLVDSSADLRWTYREWDEAVSAAARALRVAGPVPGDRVTITMASGAEFTRWYLGVLRAGLVGVPINPAYTAAEVEHIRADCTPALHLDPGECRAAARRRPGRTGPERRARRRGPRGAAVHQRHQRARQGRDAVRAGAARQHRPAGGRTAAADDRRRHRVRGAAALPRLRPQRRRSASALRVRATLVLADRFDAGRTLATMAAERVTVVLGAPAMFAAWLAHPDRAAGFAAVRFAMSGSTTLTSAVVDGYAAAGVVLHDGYGLTEAAPVVTVNADRGRRDAPSPARSAARCPGSRSRCATSTGLRSTTATQAASTSVGRTCSPVIGQTAPAARTTTAGSAPATSRSRMRPAT